MFQRSLDPAQADPNSEALLVTIPQPYANHNGGHLTFGPDGYLYVAVGDGGAAGDPEDNAQNLGNPLGTLLRLDVDAAPTYVPADNPFIDQGSPLIWAYGLRNPWRFAFDRLTGDLYIGDVGQNQWEEINFVLAGDGAGANFGWDLLEASYPYEGMPNPSLTAPVWEYDHGQGCSVTGGVVYRGTALPEWSGVYLFGDFCYGTVWGLLRDANGEWQQQTLFQTDALITSFGEDEQGEIYLIDRGGTISKLVQIPQE
jgi:glucose/arabinose dehydrogenase